MLQQNILIRQTLEKKFLEDIIKKNRNIIQKKDCTELNLIPAICLFSYKKKGILLTVNYMFEGFLDDEEPAIISKPYYYFRINELAKDYYEWISELKKRFSAFEVNPLIYTYVGKLHKHNIKDKDLINQRGLTPKEINKFKRLYEINVTKHVEN
ncbi:MAG: hypothetical protein U9Q69_02930 [Nanoarchaeota archaeon]|nr:hypothetical protein [Nanoarchaeota archaeon]